MKLILSENDGTVIEMWDTVKNPEWDFGVFEVLLKEISGPTYDLVKKEVDRIIDLLEAAEADRKVKGEN